jgi:hypothetical protein
MNGLLKGAAAFLMLVVAVALLKYVVFTPTTPVAPVPPAAATPSTPGFVPGPPPMTPLASRLIRKALPGAPAYTPPAVTPSYPPGSPEELEAYVRGVAANAKEDILDVRPGFRDYSQSVVDEVIRRLNGDSTFAWTAEVPRDSTVNAPICLTKKGSTGGRRQIMIDR